MMQRPVRFPVFRMLLPAALLAAPGSVLWAQEGSAPKAPEPYVQNERLAKPAANGVPESFARGARLYALKCAACHSLSRAMKQADLSATEWEDIVYRMRDKASSRLNDAQAKAVVSYLAWDGRRRKQ